MQMFSRVLFFTLALLHTSIATIITAQQYFEGDGTVYTLGATDAGNCNMMYAPSEARVNYAAINDRQWDGMTNCGRCAEVSCNFDGCDQSITRVVHILDRCPECKFGDLDLSPSVFADITGKSPSRLKIKWRFVDCPVSGNIQFCLKGGSNNFWTAIQPANLVVGVQSMSINGQPTGKTDSAYYYLLDGKSSSQTDLTSIKVSITSIGGETISDTVSLTAGSCTESKVQFSGGKETSGRFNENPPPLPPSPPTQQPSQAPATQAPVTQAPVTQAPTQTPTQAPTQPPTEAPIPSKLTPSPFKNHRNVPFANSVSGSLSTDPISPTDSNSLIEEWKSLSSSSADSDASDSVIGIDGPDENTSNSGDKSNSPSDQTNEITTQSSEKEGGTSPAIIILSCFAAVGMLVLATLGYKVHKKKLDDKRNDVDPLPFDLMRTPGDNERSDIAVL